MAQWGSGAWDDQEDDLRVNYDAISQMGDSATPAPQTTSSQTGGSPFDALSQLGDGQSQPQQNGTAPGGSSGVSAWDSSIGQLGDAQSGAQSGGGDDRYGLGALGQTSAQSPPATPAAGDTVSKYKTQLDQLSQTSDPRQKAVLQDGIARSLFGELKTAGHDVKWDNDQMVIDGRRYVIGDGSAPASPDVMPRTDPAAAPGAPAAAAGATPTLQQGGMTYGGTGLQQNGGGTRFEGFNDDRALSGGDPNSAKDAFRRIIGSSGINVNGLTKEQTGEVLASQVVPLLQSQGYPVEVIPGAYDQIRVFSNERGWETIDVVGAAGGDARWVWGDLAGGWGGQDMGAGIGGPSAAGTAAMTPGTQGASGVQTQSAPPPAPTVDPIGDFTPTGPGYTPGAIGTDDLPSRSYEDILGGMGEYTPSTIDPTYQFNGFGDTSAATEGGTEALIQKLLANPESLDARTVDMMKGANREEQSAMAESLDDDLTGMGYDMGLDSSAFLASERLGAKRSRDESIIRGNRDIDITAAKTNQGDRRAAAELGAGYSDSVSRRKLAEAQAGEGNKQAAGAQKLQADSLNQQNVFNAATLKSNNAVSAARVQLEQAAALNDRMGLRESVNQAAAELGISKDKLMVDFVTAKANELTQRYGIDVSKYVDMSKLSTAHSEFADDLAFRIMALQQEMELSYAQLGEGGRQFDVGAGIDLAKLQQNADQFGVDAYYRSLGI